LADATPEELDAEVQRAASIVQVSESIIKSAEVENSFLAITKAFGSGFIPVVNDKKTLIELVSVQLKEKEQEEKDKLFDVDKRDNWLTADAGKVSQNKSEYDPLKK
jgi:hypothetical protein